ncbi:MAG: FecR family protein [Prevotella sp.]
MKDIDIIDTSDAVLDHSLPNEEEQDLLHELFLRHNNPCPDIDKEWQSFSPLLDEEKPTSHHYALACWLGGAVAACIAIMFVMSYHGNSSHPGGTEVLAAIENDSNVTMKCGDEEPHAVDNVVLAFGKGTARQGSKMSKVVIKTPRGHECELTLSDGTTVWLNGESSLEFPQKFTGKERRVRMTGEAYFEVAKDARHPFIVDNDFFSTRVLGTSFLMRTYSQTDASVTLVEGSVNMRSGGSHDYKLEPGMMAQLSANGFDVTNVDTYPVTQRRAGYLYFDNETLLNVMVELGRWYNKTVVFENEKVMQTRLHFVAERVQPIEEVVEALNEMDGFMVELSDTEITVK